jgi:hypothetical protein
MALIKGEEGIQKKASNAAHFAMAFFERQSDN